MKLFLIKITLFSLPVLLLLLGVNYYGDAALLFTPSYAKRIAEIVKTGDGVLIRTNYDARQLQKFNVHYMTNGPEVLVLGSSRVQNIDSSFFPGKRLFNSAVPQACLEDIVAIFHLYDKYNKLPQKIVIGIDPWDFNQNKNQGRWKTLRSEFNEFKSQSGRLKKQNKPIRQPDLATKWFNKLEDVRGDLEVLLSSSYFQHSLKALPDRLNKGPAPLAVPKGSLKKANCFPDGILFGQIRAAANQKRG